MKLTKSQKQFIKDNYKSLSLEQLSKESKLDQQTIIDYVFYKFRVKLIDRDIEKTAVVNKKDLSNKKRANTFSDETTPQKMSLLSFISKHKVKFLILAVLSFAVYLNSFSGEFVSDDIPAYIKDPTVQNMGASLKTLNYQRIAYAINFQLVQNNPTPLHVFSFILHVLVVFLGFIFVSQLYGPKVGFITALLFAVHPAGTEAISWISGLNYAMLAFVSFLILVLYTQYKYTNNKKMLFVSYVVYLLALAFVQTPWLVICPLLVLITDQLLIEKTVDIKKSIPAWFFAVAFGLFFLFTLTGITASRVDSLKGATPVEQAKRAQLFERLVYTGSQAVYLLIFPKNLTLYHEGDLIMPVDFLLMVFTSALVIGTTIVFWFKNKRIAGLLLFMIAALGPALSPIQVAWFIADRYLYIPSLAFCLLIVLVVLKIEENINYKKLSTIIFILLLFSYSVRTILRNDDWKTPRSLWLATAVTSPNSHRAYNNLGDVYAQVKDQQTAIRMFKRALDIKPDYPESAHNLGHTYFTIGQNDIARQYALRALQLNPKLYQTTYLLGLIEYSQKNSVKATEYFNQTLKLNPSYEPALLAIEKISREAKDVKTN